jgi:hypothetical protein
MNSSTHHGHTWQGCRFARHNNISFDTFWEWAKQKADTIERKAKWQTYWMDSKLFTLTKQGWIGYLTFFYPELSLYNPNMRPETLTHTTRTIESLNVPSFEVPSLCQALFKSKHRVIIFGTGMGSGKTTQTTKYAQAKQFLKPDLNTLWICPRKTLAINTHTRFDRVNCINYMDVAHLKNKVELLRNAKTLLITLESLHYLEEEDLAKFDNMVVLFNVENPETFNVDIIVVLFKLVNPDTFNFDVIVELFNVENPDTFNVFKIDVDARKIDVPDI